MSKKIAVIGAGRFSRGFIPLLQNHPLVSSVSLAELIPQRRTDYAERFKISQTYESLDEALKSDVDAVAIFTQRQLHGPQAIAALRAGKHVYSAVPMALSVEDVETICDLVKETGLLYMTGETSYYYPNTIYCRERMRRGEFGSFVFGEAQYLHDMAHFYDSFRHSGGKDWKRVAGLPPMYYPTHSVSMILGVTGARIEKVSCMGYEDYHQDGIFQKGANDWDNIFSNETALMRTSDGGSCRINEFRRVGWKNVNTSSVYMSMFGTEGAYEESSLGSMWTSLQRDEAEDITAKLKCRNVPAWRENQKVGDEFFQTVSEVHPISRLPESFAGLPNGHLGSHQFLVDDFMKALENDWMPPNNAWDSARYVLPGLIAHESAVRGGELLSVPDMGSPPAGRKPAPQDSISI
ncbi:MAG: Gfo/Idh/MocA family protein [Christensenellales bacterium]|jgi:predicted dehydrogenase